MEKLNPFEPGFIVLCGKDSTGAIYPLLVDSSGNLVSAYYKGWYANEAAILVAYPNGIGTPADRNGWYCTNGDTDTVWLWDAGTNTWVDTLASATGDVVGPGASTDHALVRYNGVTGKLLQDGKTIEDDSGNVVVNGNLTADDRLTILNANDVLIVGSDTTVGDAITTLTNTQIIGSADTAGALETGDGNVIIGTDTLKPPTALSRTTSIGAYTGPVANKDGNTFFGYGAGSKESGNDKLFIDNRIRTNESTARTDSLVYGFFDTTASNQFFRVNGLLEATQSIKVSAGYVDLDEIATPANPAANDGRIYVKDDSGTTKLYFRDNAGVETDLIDSGGGIVSLEGFIAGNAYVAENIIWLRASSAITISKIRIGAVTAPTDATLIVDVNYHATDPASAATIFSTQANRPAIASAAHTADSGTPNTTSISDGGWLGISIDQIGSTIAGNNIVIEIITA